MSLALKTFWLARAVQLERPYFLRRGYRLPDELIVLCAPCSASANWGECWMQSGLNYIRISPRHKKGFDVLQTLHHELCHAQSNSRLGFQGGHGTYFHECAKAVGIRDESKPVPRALTVQFERWCKMLGEWPE